MIKEAFVNYPHGLLSAMGLLIFLATFLTAVIWVYRRNGSRFYDKMASLPLEDHNEQ